MQAANFHSVAWVPYVPRSQFQAAAKPSTHLPVASLRWQPCSPRNGPYLVVTHGDLTQARIDAIVSATGIFLDNGSGVGAAIVAKGGSDILKDCQAWIEKHRWLPVGQAMTTSAGSLPSSHVIHAVGPRVTPSARRSPTAQQAKQLRSAVRSTLLEAERLKLTTVAIPGISTGSNGYPGKLAAKEIVSECVDYARENASETTLTTIVFMDTAKPTFHSFKKALVEAAVSSGCEDELQKAREPIVGFQYESLVTKLTSWLFGLLIAPVQSAPFEFLTANHAEYKRALAELPPGFASRVVSVRRVRTSASTAAYEKMKTTMKGARVTEPLYHGTPQRWRASAIALTGFDLSIVSHGRSLGDGVYTTTSVALALQYTSDRGSLLKLRGLVNHTTKINGNIHVFPNPAALISVTIIDYAAEDEQDRKQIRGH